MTKEGEIPNEMKKEKKEKVRGVCKGMEDKARRRETIVWQPDSVEGKGVLLMKYFFRPLWLDNRGNMRALLAKPVFSHKKTTSAGRGKSPLNWMEREREKKKGTR